MERRTDSGQIALILVLIMTVVGTAAISLAGRTVVETRVQEINVDSTQAMLAAEAGLEQALKVAPTGPYSGNIDANTTFDVADQVVGTDYAIIGPFKSGEMWEVNLTGATGSSINLYWESSPDDGSQRGLYVSVVDAAGIADYPIAPVGFASGFDNTINTNLTLGGRVFDYERAIPYVAGTSTAMRVMVLGGDTVLGFQAADGSLTAQVRQKTAVGTVVRGNEATKQGLGYYESIADQVPGVFGFTLYSGTSIIQEE